VICVCEFRLQRRAAKSTDQHQANTLCSPIAASIEGICCRQAHPSCSEHVIPYMEGVRAEALGQTKLAFDDLVNEFNAA
jgi:hypothetical protein